MVEKQFHEDFEGFSGTDLTSIGQMASKFLSEKDAAAKSIAVVANQGGFFMSIGYTTDQPFYPIRFEEANISGPQMIPAAAKECSLNGDVLCHSLYYRNEQLTVVFLIHG